MPFEEFEGQIHTAKDGKQYKFKPDKGGGTWVPVEGTVNPTTGIFNTSPEKLKEIINEPVNRIADYGRTLRDIPAYASTSALGLPGDVQYLGRGLDESSPRKIQEALGQDATVKGIKPQTFSLPTSAELTENWEKTLGRPIHEPQYPEGRITKTIAESAPSLLGGPESVPLRVATRMVAPALTDEFVRSLTKGTPAEGYARMGSMMATPLLARRVIQPSGGLWNEALRPQVERTTEALAQYGASPRISQATGSPWWKAVENWSGVPARMSEEAQNRGLTGAALKEIGASGTSTYGPGRVANVIPNRQAAIGGRGQQPPQPGTFDYFDQKYNIPANRPAGTTRMQYVTDPADQADLRRANYQYALATDLGNVAATKPGDTFTPKDIMRVADPRGKLHAFARDLTDLNNQADPSALKRRMMTAALLGGAAGGLMAGPSVSNYVQSHWAPGLSGVSGSALSSGVSGIAGGLGGLALGRFAPGAVGAVLSPLKAPVRGLLMNPGVAASLSHTEAFPRAQHPNSVEWWLRNAGMVPGATANERNWVPDEQQTEAQ